MNEPSPISTAQISEPDLQARLERAEETLRAIRHGEVDALIVHDASADAQVFTLSSADRPYRLFVDNMRDGAATVSEGGIILYANLSLAEMTGCPLVELIGSPVAGLLADGAVAALAAVSGESGGTVEVEIVTGRSKHIPVRINSSRLGVGDQVVLCLTFADLSQRNAHKREINRIQAQRLLELERGQTALTQQATHDALTGLANRTLIVDRIAQALAVVSRSREAIGLIFVDLDRFKTVNDTRGHASGDVVLRQIASRLAAAVRPMDSVSRLGGDEFVVLLPGLGGSEDAVLIAERIAAGIGTPIELDHGSVTLTASIGLALATAHGDGKDLSVDGLIQRADAAMYHAKALGGSRVELFELGVTPSVFETDRETWVARIHDALENDRFELHAQPIIDLSSGATVKHELLLRLRGDDGQLIPPLAFLPTAERCGLIGAIDQWVIEHAARLAGSGQRVAVNLSAASVADPAMIRKIEQELRRHEADPATITFEITETAVMQNLDHGQRFAERMVALGCSFALDDFGTGFSSFTYLKRLPVQYLKIDIEFVRDVTHSQHDRAVVSAIVALARGFGQETIAEGVEDAETIQVLQDLGVTFAQGYLFGRPSPIGADERLAAAVLPGAATASAALEPA
jgi:diguanylate cyclase (GGDEF)-like protein/PAS domain S-box-containing protein